MSAEDRLAEILKSQASTVVPAGDGLARIRERVVRRRRLRLALVPVGALATAGAVVAVIALTGTGGTQLLKQDPITPGTQAPTQTPTPAPTQPPSNAPSPTATAVATYNGPAIWPFRSQAQADAWKAQSGQGSQPWAADPIQVADRFASSYLGQAGVTASATTSTCACLLGVDLSVGGHRVGTARLAQYGTDGPWTVVSVGETDLTITSPQPGAHLSSPSMVTGRIIGVDENVRLELITFSGLKIATSGAPAGSAIPWQGTLTWTTTGWTSGAVVGTTYSAKDGSLNRIVALPILPG